jgi:hypothetical protein
MPLQITVLAFHDPLQNAVHNDVEQVLRVHFDDETCEPVDVLGVCDRNVVVHLDVRTGRQRVHVDECRPQGHFEEGVVYRNEERGVWPRGVHQGIEVSLEGAMRAVELHVADTAGRVCRPERRGQAHRSSGGLVSGRVYRDHVQPQLGGDVVAVEVESDPADDACLWLWLNDRCEQLLHGGRHGVERHGFVYACAAHGACHCVTQEMKGESTDVERVSAAQLGGVVRTPPGDAPGEFDFARRDVEDTAGDVSVRTTHANPDRVSAHTGPHGALLYFAHACDSKVVNIILTRSPVLTCIANHGLWYIRHGIAGHVREGRVLAVHVCVDSELLVDNGGFTGRRI